MRFPDSFIAEIRDHNDIASVISSYVELKRRGRLMTGLCPFHNEKTPSFTVYPDTASYYCFGCGKGGDVITFIRDIENLDYVEAVKSLADRAGLRMPEESYDDSAMRLRKRILEANRAAAVFFHDTLFTEKGRDQLAYLQKRGVSQRMMTRFGLGAAPDEWSALTDYLVQNGFQKEELVAANLARFSDKSGKRHYYDAFRNKVMYPVIDLRGNVIAFGGRVLDNSKPKYINTSDTLVYKKSNELYALNLAKNGTGRKLILCEGYMDVIALHEAGFTNAVAGLGTALTSEQVSLISRYADEVVLCYDGDEAGQKAVRAALRLFENTSMRVRVLRPEGGKDPDEIIRTFGADRFQKLLDASAGDMEYKLSKLREKFQVDTADGKIAYMKEAVHLLALCGPVERDVYALKLSDELGIGKEAIMEQLKDFSRKDAYRERRAEIKKAAEHEKTLIRAVDPERSKQLRAAKAEDTILTTLLCNPSFYQKLAPELSEDLFLTPFNKRLLQLLCSRLKDGLPIELSFLSQSLTSQETGAVSRLLAGRLLVSNTIAECEDCIKVLRDEKKKKSSADPGSMNDSDFAALFANLREKDES